MTGYLLDTSILIDLGNHRLELHPRVRRWFEDVPVDELHTCTIVIGELARGVAAISDGQTRRQQEHHLTHVVLLSFPILPFDLEAALHWGAAAAVATGARVRPTMRREEVVWPCRTNPMQPTRVPSYVRRSYIVAGRTRLYR